MINEFAQWAAILFLMVFVVGLTRQLGRFMVEPREVAAEELGPQRGKVIPEWLLSSDERTRFQELLGDRAMSWGYLVVVDERCVGCDGLIEQLGENGTPSRAPLILWARQSGPEHRKRLEELGDIVVSDEGRASKARFEATPFVMILDAELRIRHKQVTSNLLDAVERWHEGDLPQSALPDATGDQRLSGTVSLRANSAGSQEPE